MTSAERRCARLVQQVVCERDRVCQRCGEPFTISAHHVFGRRNHGSAFDPDSCITLCCTCHDRWARECPQEARNLLRKKIGEERYTWLDYLSTQVVRLRDKDFEDIAAGLKQKLDRMRGR